MNKLMILLAATILFIACKHKKKEEDKNGPFFSVQSYLLAQTKMVDTSLYRITKIETQDSISDTTVIPRESFRGYAQDFLTLPDIAKPEIKVNYNESDDFDTLLKKIIMTYTAKDPQAEVQRETILLDPNDGNSQVNTIIVDKINITKDSSIVKNMLWEVDKQFQVITKSQFPGKPEKIKRLIVKWE
jgi:hypothetical protein